MRNTPVFVALLSLLFACRGGGDDTTTDAPGSANGFMTIQQVQSSSTPPGTAVSLQNVVVTAVDLFGSRTGDFWVEDPAGGPFSGVLVFPPSSALSTIESLKPGDIVTITGAEKDDFALTGSNADKTGRTDTELEQVEGGAMTIKKTGTGSVPVPEPIDLDAIGKLYDPSQAASNGGGSAFNAAWQMWAGVLVTATNVNAFGAPRSFGSGAADQFSLDISGDGELEGSLVDITKSGIAVDTCLATLTGVVDYFYQFLIYPRTASDIATGGTGCVFENAADGATLCTDGLDNDGNGFTDCADLGCEVGPHPYLGTCDAGSANGATCGCSINYAAGSGISQTNTANATTSGPVILRNVYVTAINTASRGFFISDTPTGTSGHGGFVFTSSTPPAIGSEVATLQGLAGPFPTTTPNTVEITDPTVGTVTTGATIASAGNISVKTLNSLTTGAPYRDVLVTVGPVTIGALGAHNQLTLSSGSDSITMDDDDDFGYGLGSGLGSANAPTGCANVTGILELNTQGSAAIHTINPRGSADIVAASCD